MPAVPIQAFTGWGSLAQIEASGWGVPALGSVCVLQYLFYLYRMRKSAAKFRFDVTEIESELSVAQKDCLTTRMENRILREFVSETDDKQATRVLLKHLVPNTKNGFAAFVDVAGSLVAVGQSRGLSRQSREALVSDEKILKRAGHETPFRLSEQDLTGSRLVDSLSVADRCKVKELYVAGIVTDGRLVGVILATHLFQPAMEQSRRLELFQRVAGNIGALRRVSLALETHKDELNRTTDILELRSIADGHFQTPVEMIQTFMEELRRKTGATRAALYISANTNDVAGKSFVRCGAVSNPISEQQLCRAEDTIATAGHAANETMVFDRAQLLQHGARSFLTHAMTVPLIQNRSSVGTICLSREATEGFQPTDVQLAEWAAEYLVGTILNALQRAQIEQQARTDSLTGLANRAKLDARIASEIQIALESQKDCSLLLLDLDHFKLINDTHGHPVGDRVLRSVADGFQKSLEKTRTDDRVVSARYGGEEFAILLPGVCHTGAARIAEVIRADIERRHVKTDKGAIQVTVSIGVATFPDHASNVEELISTADIGLYFAKEAGRNQIGVPQTTDEARV